MGDTSEDLAVLTVSCRSLENPRSRNHVNELVSACLERIAIVGWGHSVNSVPERAPVGRQVDPREPENERLPLGLRFPFSNAIIRDSRDLTLHTVQTDVGLDCQTAKQSHLPVWPPVARDIKSQSAAHSGTKAAESR